MRQQKVLPLSSARTSVGSHSAPRRPAQQRPGPQPAPASMTHAEQPRPPIWGRNERHTSTVYMLPSGGNCTHTMYKSRGHRHIYRNAGNPHNSHAWGTGVGTPRHWSLSDICQNSRQRTGKLLFGHAQASQACD